MYFELIFKVESMNLFFVLALKNLSSQLVPVLRYRASIDCSVSLPTGGSAQSKVRSELAMEVGQPESG